MTSEQLKILQQVVTGIHSFIKDAQPAGASILEERKLRNLYQAMVHWKRQLLSIPGEAQHESHNVPED